MHLGAAPARLQAPFDIGSSLSSKVVAELAIDVVHGYELPPSVALDFEPRLWKRVAQVATEMGMAVVLFLPRHVPLVVGTKRLRRLYLAASYRSVTLIEPPVGTKANGPNFDGSSFRALYAPHPGSVLMVVVGHLAHELKQDGLLAACDADRQPSPAACWFSWSSLATDLPETR
jgi:L-malate glycosyltransferase